MEKMNDNYYDDEELFIEEAIEYRESEIDNIIEQFLWDLIGQDENVYIEEDVIFDCKEAFLKYIAVRHGISVYRPMLTADGELEDYPYDMIIPDDT